MLALIAVFNWLVNPYSVFESVEIEHFNKVKVEAKKRQRISKAYEVIKAKPAVIYLGNSRANELVAEFPGWKTDKVYNLSLDSGRLYELWRYMQHAHAASPLKKVVLSVDYFSFNNSVAPTYKDERLLVDAEGNRQLHILGIDSSDLLASLLSITALKSSFRTIHLQDAHESYQANREKRIRNKGSHRELFDEMETDILRHAAEKKSLARDHLDYKNTLAYSQNGLLRKILRFSHKNNIKLYLYFSPVHARLLETWRIGGEYPLIEAVKKAVVFANDEEANAFNTKPFPIWDFSGYNSITTEALPAVNDVNKIMYGYWEGSHYSHYVGELILGRLSGYPNIEIPKDFGVSLNKDNIDQHLAETRDKGHQYRETHKLELQALESKFFQFRQNSQFEKQLETVKTSR